MKIHTQVMCWLWKQCSQGRLRGEEGETGGPAKAQSQANAPQRVTAAWFHRGTSEDKLHLRVVPTQVRELGLLVLQLRGSHSQGKSFKKGWGAHRHGGRGSKRMWADPGHWPVYQPHWPGQELLKASADAETHDSVAVSVKKNRGKRRKCLKTLQTGVCTPLVHWDPFMYNVSSTVTFWAMASGQEFINWNSKIPHNAHSGRQHTQSSAGKC